MPILPAVDVAYDVAKLVLKAPFTYGLRWTIEGAHTIPPRGPAILASNHVSYLDPIVLGFLAQRRDRRVRFLAKAELFDKQPLGAILRSGGQIPVLRGSTAAAGSLDAAVDALHRGECMAVFPEGTISLDLEPMVGKSGTARLAALAGVPVWPIGLWGAHRILFKGRKPRWRWGVAEVVVVGDPIRVTSSENVHEATDRIMGAIAACVRRAREIYPQQPSPGEGDWWVRSPESALLRPRARRAGSRA